MKTSRPEPALVARVAQPPPAPRRAPERMCVVCRSRKPKAGLIRVRRGPDGRIEVDWTGKGLGRGAYVCRESACWAAQGFAARLGRALGVALTEEDRRRLAAVAGALTSHGAADGV